jgi:hypothetical protein
MHTWYISTWCVALSAQCLCMLCHHAYPEMQSMHGNFSSKQPKARLGDERSGTKFPLLKGVNTRLTLLSSALA